jgi:hypothetical protein
MSFRYDLEKMLFSKDVMVQRRAFVLLVDMELGVVLNEEMEEFKDWIVQLSRLEPIPSDPRLRAVIAALVNMLRDEAHYREDEDAGSDLDPDSYDVFIESNSLHLY